jgi:hypothetical protein
MSNNDSWIPHGRPQDFHSEANTLYANQQVGQLKGIPSDIDMIVLQTGGDSAGLASVVHACLYAPHGSCDQEIERAVAYINGPNKHQLFQDTQSIVTAVFDDGNVKKNPKFELFLFGYAQFFYEQEGAGDWCNDVSFALGTENVPRLTLDVRKRINELTRALNDNLKDAVNGTGAHFIDTDPSAEGHRFCQPGHTLYDQFYGENVYFWNRAPEGIIVNPHAMDGVADNNGTYELRNPTPAEFEHWIKTGNFTDNPHKTSFNASTSINPGPSEAAEAAAHRAFHPNPKGNGAMAEAAMLSIKAVYYNRSGESGRVPYTKSLQIILRQYRNKFYWGAHQGPIRIPVNVCGDTRFNAVFYNEADNREDLSIDNPPWVMPGRSWAFNIPEFGSNGKCRYESSDSDPGALKCGDWLDYPLKADPGKVDPTMTCKQKGYPDSLFHRAWLVEY